MESNIMKNLMRNYFKYIGISNVIFYLLYFFYSSELNLSIRSIIFITISSIAMVIIPVLYLVIMTKKDKFKNIHMYLNILIVTICFDILLLSIDSRFGVLYLIKSIVLSIGVFTPIRLFISIVIAFTMNIIPQFKFKGVSN
ncbi:MAG: hypothetical protein KH369_12305 [Paraclostridium bifermentans]|uniref:hypothetical protein n=1 Tax=Paraclostridium bifermentans TaxID=1490 RepID=UPI001DE8BE3E|nr:hypothetical protein [Paraclostridium bifermentans]MBS6508973.1 hypothetical protein [Paraclostridium bifermentans]